MQMQAILIIIAQVLFVLLAVLMAFAILLQEGKGGGLSSLAGGGSQQIIGTSNPLRRITVIFAIAFFGLAIFLVKSMTTRSSALTAGTDSSNVQTDDKGTDKASDKTAPMENAPPAGDASSP